MSNLFAKLKGLIVILFLIAAPGCSQERVLHQGGSREGAPPRFTDAQTAAVQSLQTFRKLLTKDNYKDLGFESVEEAVEARLGAPLGIFLVRLDPLREYQRGSDPNTLLADSGQVYYPVLVKEQARAAIVIARADGKWKVASLGNAGLAKQLWRVQKEAGAPLGGASAPEMIVQVLGFHFIGRRGANNNLTLTPLVDDPAHNLRAGVEQPADEAFAALVPFAKSYNGLPM
jgi:hypothetical protein